MCQSFTQLQHSPLVRYRQWGIRGRGCPGRPLPLPHTLIPSFLIQTVPARKHLAHRWQKHLISLLNTTSNSRMLRTLIFIILTINSAYANYAQVLKRDGTNVTLTTNLDDNQIRYIHMYGLRINARRPGSPYIYGYLPKMGMNALFLVTTSDSNVTLASASEFINATQYSDHSPV